MNRRGIVTPAVFCFGTQMLRLFKRGDLDGAGRSGKSRRLVEPGISVHKKINGGADRRGRYQYNAIISPLEFFNLYSAALGFAAL